MKLRVFITAMTLGLAMPAAADDATNVEAYEVALSNIRLPHSKTGTIAFKPCANCEFKTHRVDGNTRWLVNGTAVSLVEFRDATDPVTDRRNEAVTVIQHLEGNRVIQVSVYL